MLFLNMVCLTVALAYNIDSPQAVHREWRHSSRRRPFARHTSPRGSPLDMHSEGIRSSSPTSNLQPVDKNRPVKALQSKIIPVHPPHQQLPFFSRVTFTQPRNRGAQTIDDVRGSAWNWRDVTWHVLQLPRVKRKDLNWIVAVFMTWLLFKNDTNGITGGSSPSLPRIFIFLFPFWENLWGF
jgi:hypothetical protein